MKTWIKWTGLITGGLILILLFVFFSLNWIAATAIERSGSSATGVQATVNGAQLRPIGGTFGMDGFSLANPANKGFESERFLHLNRADVDFGLFQMFQTTVEIPEVNLQGLNLNIERKDGTENYRHIMDHLEKSSGDESASGDQKYVVRKLIIRDIQVSFHGYSGVPQKELHLADIQLTDVGTGENGLSRSELVGIVIREAFRQLLRNPDLLPGAALEGIRIGIEELDNLGQVGVTFLGDITDGSGTVIKSLGDAAGSVGDSIGDFFGGGEDNENEEDKDE